MMTAHATVESAIEAMKLGALDYLQKPFEIDELLVVVRRALEHQRLRTRAPLPAQRARRAVRPLRHRRAQPRDGGGHPAARSWSPRPRARCSSPARPAPARSWSRARSTTAARSATAVRQGELRGDSRDAARVRAVRPRARRVHRRDDDQEGQVRAGRRRHALPRRDRHDAPDAAGEAAARAAGARVRAARLRAHARRSTCASSPRPTATCGRWSPTASSARISSTA